MESRLGTLELVEHFLVELLARTQTGKLDLHILRTGEFDHTFGKVGNLHRFTHIEDEDLTAVALGTGLEDEFTGLGNQHEETHDTLVGDGHRTAILDLLTEEGDDGTVAAEDIAETGGHKLGTGGRASHLRDGDKALLVAELVQMTDDLLFLDGLVEALDINLTDTLRTSHHIGWIHGLIGRDHHEFLHTVFHGHVGDDLGTIDIIQNGL